MLLEQPHDTHQRLNQLPAEFKLPAEQTAASPKEISKDEVALALVIQDTQRAEKFVMARLWLTEWRVAKALYEAAVKQEFWRDTLVPRASNSFPLCSQHVRAILDQTMSALFSDNPPFIADPLEGTPRQVSRGWESVVAYQLRQVRFKQQLRLITKDAEIFGTGIGKWGWESFPQKKRAYLRATQPQVIPSLIPGMPAQVVHTAESDDLDEVETTEMVSRPFFHRCEINHVMVSPGLREPDIRQAGYVVYRDYLTIRDLNKLRDFEGYAIPPEEELKALAAPPAEQAPSSAVESESTAFPAQGHRALPRYLDESESPLEHKLEVLERWDSETVIVVLQRKKTIRNEDHGLGGIPFVSCFWDDIPGAFYAFGIPRRIGSIQTHIQGLRNLRLDDINLNLQNVWLEKQGTNLTGQPIRLYPGARTKVTDPEGIKPLIKQPILGEAWREEAVLIADAEKTSGANELLVQGALPERGRTSMGRTAGGAGLLGGASSSRIQSFVDVIVEQVFLPVLYAFLHMDRSLLDPRIIRQIVGETIWADMEANHSGDLLVDMCNNADLQFAMQAGTSIASRRAMAASLPLEMQLYMAPAVQTGLADSGMKVNWLELSRRVEQSTGWKSQDDVIIPLTPQDAERRAMASPDLIKAQATEQRIAQLHRQNKDLSDQEHQQKMAEIDAKGLAGAGQDILKRAIERAAVREEMGHIAGTFEG
jgi:hypothetical protein